MHLNIVRHITATTGTGTITLGAAVTSFLTMAQAGALDGRPYTYCIEDGAQREIGRGVYTASGTTLTRNVIKSTNSDAAINLSGNAQVFITVAAEDLLTGDAIEVTGTEVNCALGDYFYKTVDGNTTFTFANIPPAGRRYGFTLEINHTSGTITLPGAVIWIDDEAPTLDTGHRHLLMFATRDGGTTIFGAALPNYPAAS